MTKLAILLVRWYMISSRCRRSDLTPDMSEVVWLYWVSPFPEGKGTLSVILFKNYGLVENVPLPLGKGLLRSIRQLIEVWG